MNYAESIAWLDDHMNLEAMVAGERVTAPTLGRITELLDLLGEPQRQYPVLHLTGTNGKTSTGRMLSALLAAHELSVGGYSSPHLESVTERISWNGEPINSDEFARTMTALAGLEPLLSERPTWFELVTAAAFAWFADIAVDAAVVEVGLGGTWDATNAADGAVAVITNVGLDHQEFLGETVQEIATEKAGIIKPGATVVTGETAAAPLVIIEAAAAKAGAVAVLVGGDDFEVVANDIAVGGRVFSLRTPYATYDDVFLALHGRHQVDNAACAIVAAEAFFDRALGDDVVAETCATMTSPGRLEVVSRRPLVLLDGAKNVAGARVARAAVEEEFGPLRPRVLVIGMLAGKGKDPVDVVEHLGAADADAVIACPAPSPRTVPAEKVAEAAWGLAPRIEIAPDVAAAVGLARQIAGEDGLVLVAGSLYVVGAARAALKDL